MNSIKFRAWDNVEKKMIYFELKDYLTIQSLIAYTKEFYSKLTFMQYIGINDKGDKDIYEKDIVDIDDGEDWNIGRDQIVFVNGCFSIKSCFDDHCPHEVPFLDGRILKVIGNLFENPELLKQKEGR